jgi:selenocysteine lyase/cysteine desulfurase
MLPSQRALFDLPREITFLNAASWSPLPLAAMAAGVRGVLRKGRPWLVDQAFAEAEHARTRRAAARLIGAQTSDVALTPSVAYGVATAAKGMVFAAGARVLVLQDDHASPTLEWMARAAPGGFRLEVVQRPDDGDWTTGILEAITRRGTAPVAFASLPSVHWADGAVIDLGRVAAALRAVGAGVLVDATQSAGVLNLDVAAIDPDFVVFPTYKWLLGPYARAFLYVAKRRQDMVPLEQTSHGRRAVRADAPVYLTDTAYVADARRFDMAERDHFVSLEMASIGMELMADWGATAVAQRLGALSNRLTAGLRNADVPVAMLDAPLRAPHVVSLTFPTALSPGLVAELAAAQIHVAARLGRLRISPHVYNDETDIDRCVEALARLSRRGASSQRTHG